MRRTPFAAAANTCTGGPYDIPQVQSAGYTTGNFARFWLGAGVEVLGKPTRGMNCVVLDGAAQARLAASQCATATAAGAGAHQGGSEPQSLPNLLWCAPPAV